MKKRLFKKVLTAVLAVALVFTSNGIMSATAKAEEVAVKGVYTNIQKATMASGTTRQITTYTQPEDATNQEVRFSSSDKKVATVSTDGVVTAVAAGKSTITVTAKDGSKEKTTVAITVLKDLVIDKKSVDSDNEVIVMDKTYGNVTINNTVGDAKVYLSGATIKGKLLLESKGDYSVFLYDSSVNTLVCDELKEKIASLTQVLVGVDEDVNRTEVAILQGSVITNSLLRGNVGMSQDVSSTVGPITIEQILGNNINSSFGGFGGDLIVNQQGSGSINIDTTNCNIRRFELFSAPNVIPAPISLNNLLGSSIDRLQINGSPSLNLQIPTAAVNIGQDASGVVFNLGTTVDVLTNSGSGSQLNLRGAVGNLTSNGSRASIEISGNGSIAERTVTGDKTILVDRIEEAKKAQPASGGGGGGFTGGGAVASGLKVGDVLFNYGFESGSYAMGKNGNASLTFVSGGKNSITSVLVGNRSKDYDGPSFNLSKYDPKNAGKHVTINYSVDVMYNTGTDNTVEFAGMVNGSSKTIGTVTANKGEWTTLTGSYEVEAEYPVVFIKTSTSLVPFFFDNIVFSVSGLRDIIHVESVGLNNTAITMGVDLIQPLTTIISPTDSYDQTVTWTSSDATVASVNDKGEVTSLKGGTAIITVTTNDGKKTATCLVTVDPNILVYKVKINKHFELFQSAGATLQLAGTVTLNKLPNSSDITWSSSDPSVATVNASGYVTVLASGQTTISATVEDASDTCDIAYYEPASIYFNEDFEDGVSSILKEFSWQDASSLYAVVNNVEKALNGTYYVKINNADMHNGTIVTLDNSASNVQTTFNITSYVKADTNDIRVDYFDATKYHYGKAVTANKDKWTVLQSGDIKVAAGAKLNVRFSTPDGAGSFLMDCVYITKVVVEPVAITAVTLDPNTITLDINQKKSIAATIQPTNYTTISTINWKSSNDAIATVDSTGKVTAIATGTATITATTTVDGISAVAQEATCEVTVTNVVATTGTVIFSNDFEGTTYGMTGTVGTGITFENGGYYSSKGIKIVRATGGWGNPGYDLTSYKGSTVVVIGYMKHAEATDQTLKLNVAVKTPAETTYPQDSKAIAPNTWTKFIKEVVIPADATEARLYFEPWDDKGNFYLDSILIYQGTTEQAETEYAKLFSKTEVQVTGVSLNKETASLDINGSETLLATFAPTNYTSSPAISWTSSDNNIATVDSTTGKVMALAAGKVMITAKTVIDTTYTTAFEATCEVTVNANVAVIVNPITLNFESGTVVAGAIGGLTSQVVTTATMAAAVSADFAPSSKMLKVVNGDYNTIPTINITLPVGTTLADYKELTARYYSVLGTDSGYKSGFLLAANELSGTNLTNNVMTSVNSSFDAQGSWKTVTFALDATKTSAVTGSAIQIGIGMSAPAGATYIFDDITLIPVAGSAIIIEDFEGTEPTMGSIGGSTVTTTVISAGEITSMILTNTSSNVLQISNSNYNEATKLTVDLAEGTTINDYSSLTFKLYLPIVTDVADGFFYKDLTISMGTTITSTTEATTLNEKAGTADKRGSWVTFTSVITPAIKTEIGNATTFEIAIGCHTNATTAYYVDDITLVPTVK